MNMSGRSSHQAPPSYPDYEPFVVTLDCGFWVLLWAGWRSGSLFSSFFHIRQLLSGYGLNICNCSSAYTEGYLDVGIGREGMVGFQASAGLLFG